MTNQYISKKSDDNNFSVVVGFLFFFWKISSINSIRLSFWEQANSFLRLTQFLSRNDVIVVDDDDVNYCYYLYYRTTFA